VLSEKAPAGDARAFSAARGRATEEANPRRNFEGDVSVPLRQSASYSAGTPMPGEVAGVMLCRRAAMSAEYLAGRDHAIAQGWFEIDRSGTWVVLLQAGLQAGADL
jgi:hypothetical protein